MKKLLCMMLLVSVYGALACPGFGFLWTWLGLRRNQSAATSSNNAPIVGQSAINAEREKTLRELEKSVQEEIQGELQAYHKNEITESKLKHNLMMMYVNCTFVLPPEKLKQLFPFVELKVIKKGTL